MPSQYGLGPMFERLFEQMLQRSMPEDHVYGGWRGGNVVDFQRELDRRNRAHDAMYYTGGGAPDKDAIEKFLRGLFYLTSSGQEWTPAMSQQAQSLQEAVQPFWPYLRLLVGDEAVSPFFGPSGSASALATALTQTNPNISGEAAAQTANQVVSTIQQDMQLPDDKRVGYAHGYSMDRLAPMLITAVNEGLITPTTDPDQLLDQISQFTNAASALESELRQQGQPVDAHGIVQGLNRMLMTSGSSVPEIAQRLRRNQEYARLGGQGGIYSAGQRAAGTSQPMVPGAYLAERDQALRESGMNSVYGMLTGATLRAANEIGLAPGSQGEQLVRQIQSGQPLPVMSVDQWKQIMAGSLAAPNPDAANMLHQMLTQRTSNLRALQSSHLAQQSIRATQGQDFDIFRQQAQQMYPGTDRASLAMRQGYLNEMAARVGYTGVGTLKPYDEFQMFHDPRTHQALANTVMPQANRTATAYRKGESLRKPFLTNIFETISNTGPENTIHGVVQSVLGAVPKSQFPAEAKGAPGINPNLFTEPKTPPEVPAKPEPMPKMGSVISPPNLNCAWEMTSDEVLCELFPEDFFLKTAARQFTVAVDLDGTLAEELKHFHPERIGQPRAGAVRALKLLKQRDCKIIIWTVRGNNELLEKWLKEHDIPYDYINQNPDQPQDGSKKIIADLYIDDRAVPADGRSWDDILDEVLAELDD